MSSTQDNSIEHIVFRGIDGNECEAFVAAIRETAYVQGKDEDDRWMLRLATAKLRGNALRWHARLDESARRDWSLFLQALFDKYPSAGGLDETDVATPVWSSTEFASTYEETLLLDSPQERVSEEGHHRAGGTRDASFGGQTSRQQDPTISSSLNPRFYDPSPNKLLSGRLRVVYEGGQTCPQYIWKGNRNGEGYWNPFKVTTLNIHESLEVNFYPFSETNEIGWTDVPSMEAIYLGIQVLGPDTSEYHPLIASQDSYGPTGRSFPRTVTNLWNVLPDGTLEATIPDSASGVYKTTTVFVDTFGENIYFAKPFTVEKTPHEGNRALLRAKIVLEPD